MGDEGEEDDDDAGKEVAGQPTVKRALWPSTAVSCCNSRGTAAATIPRYERRSRCTRTRRRNGHAEKEKEVEMGKRSKGRTDLTT